MNVATAGPTIRGRVVSASRKREHKSLIIEFAGGQRVTRKVPPFALVGKGDEVLVPGRQPSHLSVAVNGSAGQLPVLPGYFLRSKATVGDIEYEHTVSELVTAADIEGYEYLERFHYRTSLEALATEDGGEPKGVGGRKAVLLLKTRRNGLEEAAGYIELHMPLLMMKPRHELFAAPFSHPTEGVSWEKWGAAEMAQHVNRICRVARVVVSPEYRGLGLAKHLIKCAAEFAKTRWHVGGKGALFLEISAEMLNHIDFVTSAGFQFVGSTEGNLSRISKDLRAMNVGQKVNFGVMSLQNKYHSSFVEAAAKAGLTFDQFIARLDQALKGGGVSTFEPSDWYHFRSVLRFPQRYYLMGLDDYTRRYISENVKAGNKSTPREPPKPNAAVAVSGLAVTSCYSPPNTESVRTILDCFGLGNQEIRTSIIRPFDLKIGPGSVVLVAGASGSGKSVLLRALDPDFSDPNLTRTLGGAAQLPQAGWLQDIPTDESVVELFAHRYGMDATVSTFHKVGLSEAFVFVKPFNMLSRGQRYRVRMADLILRNDPLWILDEFCADLDPISAAVVAHNLRRIVLRQGRIAVVAAANHAHFVGALRPNIVLYLRSSGRVEQMTYKAYRSIGGGAQ